MNEMANIDIQIVFRVYKSILSENLMVKMKLPNVSFFRKILDEVRVNEWASSRTLSRLIWTLSDFYC